MGGAKRRVNIINSNFSAKFTRIMKCNPNTISEQLLEDLFTEHRIYSVASGEEDGKIRQYLYAKHVNFFY